jgi:hypothetical protein
MRGFSQDSRSPVRDLNSGPLKYEERMLIILQPRQMQIRLLLRYVNNVTTNEQRNAMYLTSLRCELMRRRSYDRILIL